MYPWLHPTQPTSATRHAPPFLTTLHSLPPCLCSFLPSFLPHVHPLKCTCVNMLMISCVLLELWTQTNRAGSLPIILEVRPPAVDLVVRSRASTAIYARAVAGVAMGKESASSRLRKHSCQDHDTRKGVFATKLASGSGDHRSMTDWTELILQTTHHESRHEIKQ